MWRQHGTTAISIWASGYYYGFTITHQKVTVEDTISRCLNGLRSPLPEELAAEQDYESDGHPSQDLELIAKETRIQKARAETICNLTKSRTGKLLNVNGQIPGRATGNRTRADDQIDSTSSYNS